MRFYSVSGKLIKKNVSKSIINWDGPSRSKLQQTVKKFLKPYWKGHVCYEEFPVYGTLLKVDILNATRKIAIEVNGAQHENFHPFFHNNSRAAYLQSIKRDWQKAIWLEKNGFTLIEINEDEVKNISLKFFREKFNVDIV